MRYQARAAQAPRVPDFPEGFMDSAMSDGSGADPVLVVAPRSGEVYCLCVHVPSILWWFSAMGRPRRDNGIVVETAHTLMALAMRTIPKSLFPYDVVPTTRLDHVTKVHALPFFFVARRIY
jgi:hypothetical protein